MDRAIHKLEHIRDHLLTLAKNAEIDKALAAIRAALTLVPSALDLLQHPNSVNDRKLLLEHLIFFVAQLDAVNIDETAEWSDDLQDILIDLLYKDLPHPPSTHLRLPSLAVDPVKSLPYAYRTGDGSYNNPLAPSLGKAGQPYARSVPALNKLTSAELPDAGLVFDTLLARESFKPHPGGISSLFFAFADLVIHSIFSTNPRDWSVNNASSYLDLSILYGSSDAEVESVRVKDGGKGQLLPDAFADNRLLLMPPASCALLVLFSRNHNHIAQRIFELKERGKYEDPASLTPEKLRAQDDEIFHRSRLVNCGFFMQVILRDYVGAILGMAKSGLSFRLDPLRFSRSPDHNVVSRGQGNVVSIEFNLLYRWHSTLSQNDTAWTEGLFTEVLGSSLDNITPMQFGVKAAELIKKRATSSPSEWTFNNLVRDPNTHRFSDEDLANIILDATEHRAAAFQARGIPHVLRVVEVLGILQARDWGACTLNEFRQFIGLKPYGSFTEWNPSPEIARAAQKLYKNIDNLELYPGLQAEAPKDPGPGAGLCPGYTISRAILADAVAMVRGDRLLTVDFTPYNLTSWGFSYCECEKDDGSYGGMLTKMLFTLLPEQFGSGSRRASAYAHYPFYDPAWLKINLTPKANASLYDWNRPHPQPKPVEVTTKEEIEYILSKPKDYESSDDRRLESIFAAAKQPMADSTRLVAAAVKKIIAETVTWFEQEAKDMLNDLLPKDVLRLLPVRWIKYISGLPGDEEGLYQSFLAVSSYVYDHSDLANQWSNRTRAQAAFKTFFEKVSTHTDATPFLCELKRTLRDDEKLAASLFAELVPSAAYFSDALVKGYEHYRGRNRQEITAKGIREALMSSPPFKDIYRTAVKDCEIAVGRRIEGGQILKLGVGGTGIDPTLNWHGMFDTTFFSSVGPRVVGVCL